MALLASAACAETTSGTCVPMQAAVPLSMPPMKERQQQVTKAIPFAREARCIVHDDRAATVVLIALPDVSPAQITITTLGDGKRGVMPLRVQMLDAQRAVVSDTAFDRFVQRGTQHSLTLHQRDGTTARYLLVGVDAQRLGGSSELVSGTRWVTPLYAAGVAGAYADGRETRISMPFVDDGRLEIRIDRTGATP